MPHEIAWADVREGDIVLAVAIDESERFPATISCLQFWHVLEVEEDLLHIEVNSLVGSSADGENIYDRFAGLLGLPPGTHGERK
jgi:hypothetical protein